MLGARVADVDDAVGLVQRAAPPVMRVRRRSRRAHGLDRRRGCGATSSPVDRPRTVDVPSASAASSSARCEIDLSPGTRTRAAQRRAAGDREACSRERSGATGGSRGPTERAAGRSVGRARPRRPG